MLYQEIEGKDTVFIDYDFEEVMFRWDIVNRKVYRKFYNETDESEVSEDNKLFCEAFRFGKEILTDEYFGKE